MFTLRGHLAATSADQFEGDTPRTTYSLLLVPEIPAICTAENSKTSKLRPPRKDSSIKTLQGKLPLRFFDKGQSAEPEPPTTDTIPVAIKMPYTMLGNGDCDARISLATRGGKGTKARQQFWREELASFAGKWVSVAVELHRYSFVAAAPAASQIRRKGARLVLQSIEPI